MIYDLKYDEIFGNDSVRQKAISDILYENLERRNQMISSQTERPSDQSVKLRIGGTSRTALKGKQNIQKKNYVKKCFKK